MFLKKEKKRNENQNEYIVVEEYTNFEDYKTSHISKDYKALKNNAKSGEKENEQFVKAERVAKLYVKHDKKLRKCKIKTLGKIIASVGVIVTIAGVVISSKNEIMNYLFDPNYSLGDIKAYANFFGEKLKQAPYAKEGLSAFVAGLGVMALGTGLRERKKNIEKKRAVLELIETKAIDEEKPYKYLVEHEKLK